MSEKLSIRQHLTSSLCGPFFLTIDFSQDLLGGGEWVSEDQDDRIPSEEHLGDETILVDWFTLLLALPCLRDLHPHLLHIFQDHVTMSEKNTFPQ